VHALVFEQNIALLDFLWPERTPAVSLKIAVVGCAVGSSLWRQNSPRAGHEVHFPLRSVYEIVRRKWVFIRAVRGDFHLRPACPLPEQIGISNLGSRTSVGSPLANDHLEIAASLVST